MNDEQFLNILSLVMVNTKMTLQIMHCLLSSDKCKEWDDAFKLIENAYDEITKRFKGFSLEEHDKQIRNDVIDEFKHKLFDISFDDGLWKCVTENDIDEVAEQMKDGSKE